MNVRLAAQTLSSSVADAIELFDLLNVKNPHGKGFKQTIRLENKLLWENTISKSIGYLLSLTDLNNVQLITHRRRTFAKGFIIAALSTRDLSIKLLTKTNSPFNYVLTYKFCQDHLELLFACIRGKNGFSNNPDVRTFKAALKRILLRVSVIASRHGNCLVFESDATSPIFSLKLHRKHSCTIENNGDAELDSDINGQLSCIDYPTLSYYKEATLVYIGGFIVGKLLKSLSCEECSGALVKFKDRGGLIYPSADVLKILKVCEIVFRTNISGDNFKEPQIKYHINLKFHLRNKVLGDMQLNKLFTSLENHHLQNGNGSEDLHSFQITKAVIDKFLEIRLLRHGQHYTQLKLVKTKVGLRQQYNKLVLFQGL